MDWFLNNIVETITIIALLINTVALLFVIYQTYIAEESLSATKKSIDNAKTQRQLEILPNANWVIEVRVNLEFWKRDLEEKQCKLKQGVSKRDGAILQGLSNTRIKNPEDLALSYFVYEKIPPWLKELWISGAQYYYNAIAPLPYIWRKNSPNFDYAESWSKERCTESIESISILLCYLDEMVPPVILDTPASISRKEFFK
ncbi:hypothetical protein KKC45_02310 [Patescibacteria group bacterium]|nr:hypothetical protein [Patescibacteria group bacterium]